MARYVKLENGSLLYAPRNFTTEDGATIINFDKDVEIMLEHGYKEFVPANRDYSHEYIVSYDETPDTIVEILTIDEEAEQRREEERQRMEEERKAQWHMTRGDFFEGLIRATGFGEAQLRSYLENMDNISALDKKLYLNRFDNALDFYRIYPAVDMVGALLGITTEQLDRFFEYKEYTTLIPNITTQYGNTNEQITGLDEEPTEEQITGLEDNEEE